MEDLMVLMSNAGGNYEFALPPASYLKAQTAALHEEMISLTSMNADRDAEGYIHHFRDDSPQRAPASQISHSATSVAYLHTPPEGKEPIMRSKHSAESHGTGSTIQSYAYCQSNEASRKSSRSLTMSRPRLDRSFSKIVSRDRLSDPVEGAGSARDSVAWDDYLPTETELGKESASRWLCSCDNGKTDDRRALQGPSRTDSRLHDQVHDMSLERDLATNADEDAQRNHCPNSDSLHACQAESGNAKFRRNGLLCFANAKDFKGRSKGTARGTQNRDTSAIPECHDAKGIDLRRDIDDNQGISAQVDSLRYQSDKKFKPFEEVHDHNPRLSGRVVGTNGESKIIRRSSILHSQDMEWNNLLAVCSPDTTGSLGLANMETGTLSGYL